MIRKMLIIVLLLALVIELSLTCGAFFATEATLKKFGVQLSADTAFLGYIIAWCLLFVSIICVLAIWQVTRNKSYAVTCYILGIWWIGIGIGIYMIFKKPDNLFIDSLKGLIIVLLTAFSRKDQLKS